ncbi:MAG: hypothetical protein ACRDNS_17890 [Trebonia sp.]
MHRLLAHARVNAVAYVALFVALGGTSYAAVNLPAGSVGTTQLRNGSVTGAKLARGAVSAASLNSKTLAGHIALWAQIQTDGHVASSSPRATVVSYAVSGTERVTWPRRVSYRCIALANPTNVGPLTSSATANATGPTLHRHSTAFVISTFSRGGTLTPEPVNVIVVCP